MTSIALTSAPVTTLDVDALIVGITDEGKKHVEGPSALPDDVRIALEGVVESTFTVTERPLAVKLE